MKRFLLFTISIVLLASCKVQRNSIAESQWELVFEDEFDGDLRHWYVWESGAYNEEIQYYTGEQVTTRDGLLIIEAKRQKLERPSKINHEITQKYEYVSSRIESAVQYGPSTEVGERIYRFAARIKLPRGHGMWPAFWTYGEPWPTQGEIDILEFRGGEPDKYQSNIFYGVEAAKNINKKTESYHDIGEDLTADFHVCKILSIFIITKVWLTAGIVINKTLDKTYFN